MCIQEHMLPKSKHDDLMLLIRLTLSRQGCRDGKGVNISGSYGQTIDSCGEKLV
jgi:hypothetical protein